MNNFENSLSKKDGKKIPATLENFNFNLNDYKENKIENNPTNNSNAGSQIKNIFKENTNNMNKLQPQNDNNIKKDINKELKKKEILRQMEAKIHIPSLGTFGGNLSQDPLTKNLESDNIINNDENQSKKKSYLQKRIVTLG